MRALLQAGRRSPGAKDTNAVEYYRFAWLLWAALIIVVTTSPWSDFHFYVREGHRVVWFPFQDVRLSKRWAIDVMENIFLFIPFSYLYLRSQVRTHPHRLMRILLGAALLSGTIEGAQLFNTSRVTSMTDVVTNTIGALLGAWFYMIWRGKRSEAMHSGTRAKTTTDGHVS
jgi:glycopeptide antibiotics resistance protein